MTDVIETFMTRSVHTIGTKAPLTEAHRLMNDHGIRYEVLIADVQDYYRKRNEQAKAEKKSRASAARSLQTTSSPPQLRM